MRITNILPTHRCGYTLVEVMVSLLSASVLVAGLYSAVAIALKATDTSNTPKAAIIDGDAALSALLSDLEFARAFDDITSTAFTLTVADRDGDSNPDTIRYAWTGVAGDPLTRQVNGGAIATCVDNVHLFQHDLPFPTANLLVNADIEAGTTGWQAIPGATMFTQSTPVYAGSSALYAYRNTASLESGVRQDVTSLLASGTSYELSAWMRKWAGSSPFDVRLLLRVTSSIEGEQIFASAPTAINSTNYLQVKGTVTPTWTGTLTSAYWEASGISSIQEIYVDDAALRVKTSVDHCGNISLQVGSDAAALYQSGVRLPNTPL